VTYDFAIIHREFPFVARARDGWGKGDYKDLEIPPKKSGEARKRAGKKKRGSGGNEFLPARQYRAEGAVRVGSGGAFCVSRRAKQKIFLP
jgi:hypothetical protein